MGLISTFPWTEKLRISERHENHFYQEVEVREGASNSQYERCKGVVLGISEENGVVYGYAVALHGRAQTIYFVKDDLVPTGVNFKREDFY